MSQSHLSSKRIRQLVTASGAIFLLFGLRLIDVQAVQAGGYTARANSELLNSSILLAPRGTITDINGVELARSVAAINIVVDQVQISDPTKTANFVAPYLSTTPGELLPLLSGTKRYQNYCKTGSACGLEFTQRCVDELQQPDRETTRRISPENAWILFRAFLCSRLPNRDAGSFLNRRD
jgi:cell division protein FtsI/penicillin-binding protein 2